MGDDKCDKGDRGFGWNMLNLRCLQESQGDMGSMGESACGAQCRVKGE